MRCIGCLVLLASVLLAPKPAVDGRVFSLPGEWVVKPDADQSRPDAGFDCRPFGSFRRWGCCPQAEAYRPDGVNGRAMWEVEDLLALLANKTLHFSGDSVTLLTYNALVATLRLRNISFTERMDSHLPNKTAKFHCRESSRYPTNECHMYSGNRKARTTPCMCTQVQRATVAAPYNATVTCALAYSIQAPPRYVDKDDLPKVSYGQFAKRNTMLPEVFEHLVDTADHVVANLGLHYGLAPGYTYGNTVRYISDVLLRSMAGDPSKRHLWRSTYPTHFAGGTGDYETHRGKPSGCATHSPRHWTDLAARGLLEDDVDVLDYYHPLADRGHLHPGNSTGDCVHYCYAYELFAPFWHLLYEALRPGRP